MIHVRLFVFKHPTAERCPATAPLSYHAQGATALSTATRPLQSTNALLASLAETSRWWARADEQHSIEGQLRQLLDRNDTADFDAEAWARDWIQCASQERARDKPARVGIRAGPQVGLDRG